MPSEVREQLRGLLRDFSSGYPSDKMTDIYLNRILSVIGEEIEGMEQEMVSDDLTYGDTQYNSNAVRYGINLCLTDLRARLEK